MNKLELLTNMYETTATLTVGLAQVVHEVLPKEERYKVEVLIDAHNDALLYMMNEIKKEKGE